ncbi:MAG: putative Macrolide-specific efflux protein macA precursor [Pedosphaera sp.]|nr:putative Macrolide-specific efflux protein macA precursor [Pedosphaera sp.]
MLAALMALALMSCSKSPVEKPKAVQEEKVPVTVAKVELVTMDRTLPVVGTLYPKDETTLGAEVEGKVEKTLAEFGDRLKQGQEIALIDTTTYEALARQTAANLAKAKANSVNAEQNLKRIQELKKQNISSQSDLDKAMADAGQWDAEVKSAEATDAIAQLNLARSHVKAPFDCAVAERIATVGDYMKVGAPVFRLVNDNMLKYIVQAPEKYAGQVEKEQLVTFNVDAFPKEQFEGKVYLISPAVNTATRSYAFGALVQNKEHKLKASSFARGEVILQRDVPTPMIPIDAVINFAGITKVFVIENEVAHSRPVKVGRITQGRQEVLDGVKPGEMVVITGQTKLRDESKVRIKEATSEPAAKETAQK